MAVGVATHTQGNTGNSTRASLSAESKVKSLLALEVPVSVILAERDMQVESILAIRIGTIIEFDVLFDSELVLHAANEPIARGQAVKSGENFGIRITAVDTVAERVQALGGNGQA